MVVIIGKLTAGIRSATNSNQQLEILIWSVVDQYHRVGRLYM